MPSRQKASIEQIVAAYAELGNVWSVAERLGMCGQSVQERLVRAGIPRKNRPFTDGERSRLVAEYQRHADTGTIPELASYMGRTRHFLCRMARGCRE